jgi:hypothetical protein
MRKAKIIRKLIFGDFSHRQRQYTTMPNGMVRCVGRRQHYKEAKKAYKAGLLQVPSQRINRITKESGQWL